MTLWALRALVTALLVVLVVLLARWDPYGWLALGIAVFASFLWAWAVGEPVLAELEAKWRE